MVKLPKVSIVFTHWAQNQLRSDLMRKSMESLLETTQGQDVEIIVVDNGGNIDDSWYLLNLCDHKEIASYTRYRENMHFAYARNDALVRATGDYIVVSDNDILFSKGWLEECVGFLVKHPGKYLATPIAPDPMNSKPTRWVGEVDGWKLNTRAGSNIFVLRREDFEEIGYFDIHRIAGSLWCDRFCKLGYKVAVMPKPKALDLALRNGYNLKEDIKNKSL